MVEYVTPSKAAESLGVSRSTVSRAARSGGVGVFVEGRLVAISPNDIDKIKPFIHQTPGNPNWIARAQKQQKSRFLRKK
jgi:DNA-binding LacI/PurR family transcriptional regulator